MGGRGARQLIGGYSPFAVNLNVSALDHLAEGVCAVNLAGTCVFANPAAERLLGHPEGALLHQDLDLAIHSSVRRVLGTRHTLAGEDALLRSDGSPLPASWTVGPIEEAGSVVGAVLSFADLTEIQALRSERERLLALDSAKAQCMALTAHELRTPLAALLTYVSLVEQGALGQVSPQLIAVLPVLSSRLREMDRMIAWLTDIARLEDGRLDLGLETIDLRGLAEQAAAVVESRAWPARRIALAAPARPVQLLADPLRLSIAIGNLLENAIKYSPKGGPVSCRIEVVPGFAMVTVRDQGIGIDPEQRHRLFTRFGRLIDERHRIAGTGLGLYLAREIARAHGGDISYQARRGRGSCFTMRLPLAVPEKAPTLLAEDVNAWQLPVKAGVVEPVPDHEAVGDRKAGEVDGNRHLSAGGTIEEGRQAD